MRLRTIQEGGYINYAVSHFPSTDVDPILDVYG